MVRARIFVWASVVTFIVQKFIFYLGLLFRPVDRNLSYKSATQQELTSDDTDGHTMQLSRVRNLVNVKPLKHVDCFSY